MNGAKTERRKKKMEKSLNVNGVLEIFVNVTVLVIIVSTIIKVGF